MSFCRMILLSATLLRLLSAQGYSLQTIPFPASPCSFQATSINNRGAIVGSYGDLTANRGFGFKRDANGVIELPINDTQGSYDTLPAGINDSGEIVGVLRNSQTVHGFLLTGGTRGSFTEFDLPPNPLTFINGINNLGDFAGSTYSDDNNVHGFVNIGGAVTQFDVPGSHLTYGNAVAGDGTVVGYYLPPKNENASALGPQDNFEESPAPNSIKPAFKINRAYGFIRGPRGNFVGLQVGTGPNMSVDGINNEAGLIVGQYFEAGRQHPEHGFVYNYVAGLAAASDAAVSGTPFPVKSISVQNIDYPNAIETNVTGVNSKGEIVGWAQVLGGCYVSFIGTPNP